MKRTVLALVLAAFAVGCEDTDDDVEVDTSAGTDVDTGADTEADTELDTEADTDVLASCDDPISGGALGGDLRDVEDDAVVADMLVSDRCTVMTRDLSFDFERGVYPAILVYSNDIKVGELWVDYRVYDMEDIDVSISQDANGSPLWDGESPLTVILADAL